MRCDCCGATTFEPGTCARCGGNVCPSCFKSPMGGEAWTCAECAAEPFGDEMEEPEEKESGA